MSKKINKELMGMTEDFTPEKKEFYKKIIVSLYTKWIPLFEEAKIEAYQKLNKSKWHSKEVKNYIIFYCLFF